MRTAKFTCFAIFICISCLSVCISLSGCVHFGTNPSTNVSTVPSVPPVANGHVYVDGKVVSGASVEAVAINGTDHISTTTDDKGAYVLNITPYTKYNVTAMYQGLRHTVWPVYLENKADTYNINLTTTPRSTIEGTGTIGGDTQFNVPMSNLAINLVPVTKNNTTISTIMNGDGSCSLEVEPNMQYEMTGTMGGVMGSPPIAQFYYRNYPAGLGDCPQITVGSNETALLDVEFVIP